MTDGSQMKRLRKELSAVMMSSHLGFSAFPDGDSLWRWSGIIHGPPNSVYEGLSFKLKIVFPRDYPFSPPKMAFTTPLFHPNVSTNGDICLDILDENWSSVLSIQQILMSLQSLLPEPNCADPLNMKAARLWPKQDEFKKRVMEMYKDPHEEE